MTLPPDDELSPEARACFFRVQSRLLARGEWEDVYAIGLAVTAAACDRYLRFGREIQAQEGIELAEMAACRVTLEHTRLLSRKALVQHRMIAPERERHAVINSEGLDQDIASLCAPWP